MEPMTAGQVADHVHGRVVRGNIATLISDVSIDSRTLNQGALFVALTGPQRDGHQFINQAAGRGAVAALVTREVAEAPDSIVQILVPDAFQGLQRLATWYRSRFTCPVVGVTGSNGKTMTKELLAHVLEGTHRVHKNFGNLNNELGVPLTLFGMESFHTMSVVEMGINHFGEMKRLAAMVQPTMVVLTNIGPVHTEFLEHVEGVARAKAEILEGLQPHQVVVVNGDEETVLPFVRRAEALSCTVVRAGLSEGCEVQVTDIVVNADGTSCVFRYREEVLPVNLKLHGVHQARNAAIAAAAALRLGVSFQQVTQRLSSFTPALKGRFRIVECGGVTYVDDSYNANPMSMRAALEVVAGWTTRGRRIAVLGDMYELGVERIEAHEKLGEAVARLGFDHMVAVGPMMKAAAARAATLLGTDRVSLTESAGAAAGLVCRMVRPGDVVLVKGSRAMHLEEVVSSCEADHQKSKIEARR